jgi:hypothetical protein
MGTEYFKHGIYSPFFSLQNAVCSIIITCLVPVLLRFYIQGVLKFKQNSDDKILITVPPRYPSRKKGGSKKARKKCCIIIHHSEMLVALKEVVDFNTGGGTTQRCRKLLAIILGKECSCWTGRRGGGREGKVLTRILHKIGLFYSI